MSETRVREAYERIESWLSVHAPPLAEELKPGTTNEGIRSAETRLGFKFTEEASAYFRAHNGAGWPLGLVESEFLTLDRCVDEHSMMNGIGFDADADSLAEPEGPVRPVWWNEKWLPFVGEGNMLCLDFDPPPEGTRGQVIEFMKSSGRRTVLFDSVASWLESWADALEADTYYFDDEECTLLESASPGAIPTQPIASEAERLFALLIEMRAIEVKQEESKKVVENMERLLATKRSAGSLAKALEALFRSNDHILDLKWNRGQLEELMNAW